MSGEHCSSEELKARLAAKFLMNEGKQMKDLTHEEVFGNVGTELNLKDAAEYLEISESELYDTYVSEIINAELKALKKGWKR